MTRITPMIGSSNVNAAMPARGSNSIITCSGPNAVDEMASGEIAPSATGFDSLSDSSCSLVSGLPRKIRFHPSLNDGGMPLLPSDAVTTYHFPPESATCGGKSSTEIGCGPGQLYRIDLQFRAPRGVALGSVGHRDPGSDVVRDYLCACSGDPADDLGDHVRRAVVQQPAQQLGVLPARQQHRDLGVRVLGHELDDQLMSGPAQVAVQAVHQPQLR